MNTGATSSTGFLTFNKGPPKLYITGDEDEPDPVTFQHFQDEGFETSYIPCRGERKVYRERLKSLSTGLQLGESYAIVGTDQ